jgi:hypothetical protein
MSYEVKKENVSIDKTISKLAPQVMVGYDVIVPDKKADVLKVLQVDSAASTTSHELKDGHISINGKIDYSILYLSEDANSVESINLSQNFNHIEDIPLARAKMNCVLDCEISHVAFSLVNSRKITLESTVELSIEVLDKQNLDIMTEIETPNVESKSQKFKTCETVVNTYRKFAVMDKLLVPPGKETIGKILKFDVAIYNQDTKIINNKVIVKGEVTVTTLYIPEAENRITYMEHSVPFTEILDVEGISEDLITSVDLCICDKSLEAIPDDDNDMRMMEFVVSICANIRAKRIVDTMAITDCYATDREIDIDQKNVQLTEAHDIIKVENTIKDVVHIGENAPTVSKVYNVIAKPYVNTARAMNDKIELEGTLNCYILYICENADSPVYTYMFEIPFKMMNEANCDEGCMVYAKLQATHVSFNISESGEIEIRANVSGMANIVKNKEINMVSDIKESQKAKTVYPTLVMCFVGKNEQIWDIAKHYRVKSQDIVDANKLENNKLFEGAGLIIPTK